MRQIAKSDLHALYTASTATAALPTDGSAPSPTTSTPTGTGSSAAIAVQEWPAIRFLIGGVGTAGTTINYRIIGWSPGPGLWMPQVLASGVATLGAMVWTVTGLDTAETRLADTISDTVALAGTTIRSPGDNTVADVTLRPGGCTLITVETDLGTAETSASVYWQAVDEDSPSAGLLATDLGLAASIGTATTAKAAVDGNGVTNAHLRRAVVEIAKATSPSASVLYNGGGTANALQVTATSAMPAGAAAISTGANNILEISLFCSDAAQTPTLSVAEYSADTPPTPATLTIPEEYAMGGDQTRTQDRACVGLATGTENYAKHLLRAPVTPGSYVVLSLSAALAAGTAYLRYRLKGAL